MCSAALCWLYLDLQLHGNSILDFLERTGEWGFGIIGVQVRNIIKSTHRTLEVKAKPGNLDLEIFPLAVLKKKKNHPHKLSRKKCCGSEKVSLENILMCV